MLFAFHQGPELPEETHSSTNHIVPDTHGAYAVLPETNIGIWCFQPRESEQGLVPNLTALLETTHTTLRMPAPITCPGFLPDVDTINPGNTPLECCAQCGELIAFAPNPMCVTAIFDRVCPRCDCLRNKRLCHIIGQGICTTPPFVKRVLIEEDLLTNIEKVRTGLRNAVQAEDASDEAEPQRHHVLRIMGELTESYIKLTRADTTHTEQALVSGSLEYIGRPLKHHVVSWNLHVRCSFQVSICGLSFNKVR